MNQKIRLDQYLTDEGLFPSREKAKAAVMAGLVYVNGQKASKAGDIVRPGDKVEARSTEEFVSRGGHKLKKAGIAYWVTFLNGVAGREHSRDHAINSAAGREETESR